MPLALNSEISHTTLIGEDTGIEEVVVEAGTAECSEAGYRGTLTVEVVEIWDLGPEFASCGAFGFASSEIDPNKCVYSFVATEAIAEGSFEGEVDIDCPEGEAIEVNVESGGTPKCTVTIGSQKGLTAVTFTNGGSGSSRDVKVALGLKASNTRRMPGKGPKNAHPAPSRTAKSSVRPQ